MPDILTTLQHQLSSNAGILMVHLYEYYGKGDYGFGKLFGWFDDLYGVNWQLNVMN